MKRANGRPRMRVNKRKIFIAGQTLRSNLEVCKTMTARLWSSTLDSHFEQCQDPPSLVSVF